MFKRTFNEMRESLSVDYARQILHDNRAKPYSERLKAVKETDAYKTRIVFARIRGLWIGIVGLIPLGLVAVIKAITTAFDGDVRPAIALPILAAYVILSITLGWRLGTLRAEKAVAQRRQAQ